MFLNAPRAEDGGVLSGLWPAGLKKQRDPPLKKTELFQDRLKRKSRESVAAKTSLCFLSFQEGSFQGRDLRKKCEFSNRTGIKK